MKRRCDEKAGEIAQLATCFLCNRESLSSIPSTHIKSGDGGIHSSSSCRGGGDRRIPGGPLANRSNRIDKR